MRFNATLGWLLVGTLVAAVIAFTVSFQAGIFALLFGLIGWWTWYNPVAAFTLLVVLSPLLPMLKITQTIGTVTLLKDVIILALFASLMLLPLLQQRLPYRRNVLLWPLVALVLVTFFGILRADSVVLGVLRSRDILLYPLLFMSILYLPLQKGDLMRITKWFVMSAVVVVGLAAWQWFGAPDSTVLRFDPVREVWIPRVSSVLAHPSVFGHYLVAVAGLAATAGIVLTGRHRWWLLGFIGLMAPLFLTYSRAVWLGMAAALAAMTFVLAIQWLQQRGARTALIGTTSIIVASIVLFIGSLAFTPAGTFLRSAIDPTYASNEERLEFMVRLLAPLSNTEALIGKGLGDVLTQNFREVSVSSYDIASGASRNVQLAKDRTLVDNQHLKTFVELGLAGLLVYAWLYWRLARTSFASAISRDTTQRILGVWSFGFLAAFVLQGFFIDIWDIYPTNVTFWIIAGLTSRYSLSTT